MPWTLVDAHSTRGRTFQRPLDNIELGYLWDSCFDGTTDNIHHFQLRLIDGSRDSRLFSNDNIIQAWLSTKKRYPLSGATLYCNNAPFGDYLDELRAAHDPIGPGPTRISFVVRERDLAVLRPNEVIFEDVSCLEEVQERVPAILLGSRALSDQLLVRLYIFRETSSGRSDVLHLVALMSHCIMDVIGNMTFARCLLDTLARGAGAEPVHMPLEERLATMIAAQDLAPMHLRSHSPAKRRWRMAVGHVIFQLRMQKCQGGHTLPCRFTHSTPRNPAKSGLVKTFLTSAQSSVVLSNCRLHNITFGNAYFVLAQAAMTRVLYRRYLRGEISQEEWDYRKRQPHITYGPFNLRPYLDKEWFENGGGGEFMNATSYLLYRLPFMTLGAMECGHDSERVLSDDAPPLSELLTFDRFLHRARLVKKQAAAFFAHPLFFEIAYATYNPLKVESLQLAALEWMRRVKTGSGPSRTTENTQQDEVLAVKDRPLVFAHTGSSFGNMDPILPSEYPLPPSHPLSPFSPLPHPAKAGYITPSVFSSSVPSVDLTPTIALEDWTERLHHRPGGAYLGASTWRGRLKMFAHYDGNVLEEGVVNEWFEEIKEAALWYLGKIRPSRQHQQATGSATMPAKL